MRFVGSQQGVEDRGEGGRIVDEEPREIAERPDLKCPLHAMEAFFAVSQVPVDDET